MTCNRTATTVSYMVTPNATVADRVRGAIKRAGFSQKTVSSHAGISRVTLTRRLMCHSSFTADELIAIAGLLDVKPSYFLADLSLTEAS